MTEITIQSRFSTGEYRVLEQIARKHDTQVHHLIEALVRKAITPTEPKKWDALTYQVGELARDHNDMEIAAELGISRDQVRLRRRRLNIPPAPVGRPSQIQQEKRDAA